MHSGWRCAVASSGDTSQVVNLTFNPERNTGYNGTHIWNAIYQENCIANEVADMCYVKRLLYRLLSGLHTSTTLSIAKNTILHPCERDVRIVNPIHNTFWKSLRITSRAYSKFAVFVRGLVASTEKDVAHFAEMPDSDSKHRGRRDGDHLAKETLGLGHYAIMSKRVS